MNNFKLAPGLRNLLILLAFSSTLSACGIADRLAEDCGGEFKQLCQAVFGYTPEQVDELQDEVIKIKAQIQALENQNAALMSQVTALELNASIQESAIINLSTQAANLEAQISFLQASISSLQNTVSTLDASNTAQHAALQSQIMGLQSLVSTLQSQAANTSSQLTVTTNQITTISNQITATQTQVAQNVAQIAVLNGFTHVTEIIDPCGDHPTKFDEVLLRIYRPSTNSYAILASFSDNASGLNTRFSIVPQGSYVTTDGTNCAFQVGPAPNFNVTW